MKFRRKLTFAVILVLSIGSATAHAQAPSQEPAGVAVGPQYDTTHVYVAPQEVDAFVTSFLGTFGGKSTKQVIATVTPTASSTTSQLLQTPVGTVSVFGFTTPIPAPFGNERYGYLVTNMTAALAEVRRIGADLVVTPYPDPIGVDAIVQWPGGLMMQVYWHTTAPSYLAFQHVPDNRVYVSAEMADSFIRSFLTFSQGQVVADEANAPGIQIGRSESHYRRVQIESAFGKMMVLVTDGHLPYPYGRESTGYEVDDLNATLIKAKSFGVTVLVPPYVSEHRQSAIVQFPGGYVAELHSQLR